MEAFCGDHTAVCDRYAIPTPASPFVKTANYVGDLPWHSRAEGNPMRSLNEGLVESRSQGRRCVFDSTDELVDVFADLHEFLTLAKS